MKKLALGLLAATFLMVNLNAEVKTQSGFIKTEPCPKEFKCIAGDWKVKRDKGGNRIV